MSYSRDKGVTFGKGAAKELAAQAIRLRGTPVNTRPRPFKADDRPDPFPKAIATSDFTAATGLTPGAGTATVYWWNGTAMVADADLTGVAVKSWWETYLPKSGAHINVYWADDVLWLGPGDCPPS